MARSLAVSFGLALALSLSACGGDTCESVQDQIEEVGREIQKDPSKAMDEGTQKKLQELQGKLQELGCLG